MNLSEILSNANNAVLIINKPIGLSSMGTLRKIKKMLTLKKIGHAGTLDPLASGVLIVCTGNMTKKINTFMNMTKEYTADINLTAFSNTDDSEGELTKVDLQITPNIKIIESTINTFVGTIQQTPSKFSAIKINGKRAYKKARAGESFDMPKRTITIHFLKIKSYEWPILRIHIKCSKGTYIRTLARDLGEALNTGGYLSKLTRTAIGPYKLNQAISLEKLQEISHSLKI